MATVLALVAINTLLFLGLSVSKVAPWPDPLHPRSLRSRANRREGVTDKWTPRGDSPLPVRQRLLLGLVLVLHRLDWRRR